MAIARFRPHRGINNDLPPQAVGPDFYTDGQNVQFRERFARRSGGHTEVYDGLQITLRALLNLQVSGTNYWIYCGKTQVYVVETTNHTDLTPGGGLSDVDDPNRWSVSLFNGTPILCNGIDTPKYWDGNTGNNVAELTGWVSGDVARVIRPHRYHLFALNYSTSSGDFPMGVKWSDAAAAGAIPSSWTASASNEAGTADLAATGGPIIDGESLRDTLAIYKQHSAFVARYIGGNEVYEFSPMFTTTGVLTRNCIADWNGNHLLVTDGDIVVTDGAETRSVVDDRMRNWLFNQLDSDNYQATFAIRYAAQDEIWICFPSSGNTFCDLALVINTTDGALGVRELPAISAAAIGLVNDEDESNVWNDQNYTWDTAHQIWNQQQFSTAADNMILAKPDDGTPTDSQFLQVDSGNTFDGTNVSANVVKGGIDLGDPTRYKIVRRIIPDVEAQSGTELTIKIGAQDTPEDSIAYSADQTFVVGTDAFLDVISSGRLFTCHVSSDGTNRWTLVGFELEYEVTGFY